MPAGLTDKEFETRIVEILNDFFGEKYERVHGKFYDFCEKNNVLVVGEIKGAKAHWVLHPNNLLWSKDWVFVKYDKEGYIKYLIFISADYTHKLFDLLKDRFLALLKINMSRYVDMVEIFSGRKTVTHFEDVEDLKLKNLGVTLSEKRLLETFSEDELIVIDPETNNRIELAA